MENQIPHRDSEQSMIVLSMIEDNKKVRESVLSYLNYHSDITIPMSFGSAESYFEHIEANPDFVVDLLLLDIGLPGISGLDAIENIVKHNPDIDIIILTTYEEEKIILKAMCLGAVAYLSKRSSLESILEAVRVVNRGGSYMSPMIAREFFKVMVKGESTSKEKKVLTQRQKEILERLVERKTYGEIASELYISVETVRSHIKKLYKILNVSNRTEAIQKWIDGRIA